jgi:hypothetical protein
MNRKKDKVQTGDDSEGKERGKIKKWKRKNIIHISRKSE